MKYAANSLPAIILDCDIRSQEGIIQPLGRRGIPIIALSSKNDCPAFHSKYVKRSIVSPELGKSESDYIEFLMQLPEKGVLFYSNDVSAVVISKYRKQLGESGFLLNITKLSCLEKVFDKWECFKLAKKLDIPMANSLIVKNADEVLKAWDNFRKPIILKGTRLAGGNYYKINRKDQIFKAWEKLNWDIESYPSRRSAIIMQEWCDYEMTDNWSCETVFTQDGQPAGFFTIRRIRCSLNKDGSFSSRLFAGHYEYNDVLVEMTKKILSTFQWKGFAHVEYFYVPKEKQFFLTEVNPRLPGYSYYPGTAGFNMAYYYYADLMGADFTVPKSFPLSVYFESFDYPGDLTEAFVHIPKAHLRIIPFVLSYLKLFKPGCLKIIDPVRLDDLNFTMRKQLENIYLFMKKIYNHLKKDNK